LTSFLLIQQLKSIINTVVIVTIIIIMGLEYVEVQWLTLLMHILKVLASSLCTQTGNSVRFLRLPRSLLLNTRISLKLSHYRRHSHFFPINYSPIILGLDAMILFPPPPPWRYSRLVGQGLLIIEASRSHSDTPHSVGLLWTSDQPDAETST
jgi:hypothetical protein